MSRIAYDNFDHATANRRIDQLPFASILEPLRVPDWATGLSTKLDLILSRLARIENRLNGTEAEVDVQLPSDYFEPGEPITAEKLNALARRLDELEALEERWVPVADDKADWLEIEKPISTMTGVRVRKNRVARTEAKDGQ